MRVARHECSTLSGEDVRAIRENLGKSQTEFALLIGVSVATLRNWEEGRRIPEGPARALLRVVAGAIESRTALRLIREWALRHRNDLEENWRLAKGRQPLRQIAPLE